VPTNATAAPAKGDFPSLARGNVGLLNPAILQVRNGDFNAPAGQTYENLDIKGTLLPGSNTTFRNCRVRNSGWFVVRPSGTGVVFEDCEFDGLGGQGDSVIFYGDGWVVRRCYIHGAEDGIKLGSNCRVEDSLIADLRSSNANWHADGIQMLGGSNSVVYHNTIDVSAASWPTSCILLKSDAAPIQNITMDYNYFNGGAWTIYSGLDGGHGNPTGNRLRYNRFGRDYNYGPVTGNASEVGNVWDDTGTSI
jgi:hypothetical protein